MTEVHIFICELLPECESVPLHAFNDKGTYLATFPLFLYFAYCQLPNYTENENFEIRISQNAKNPLYAPLLVNPPYTHDSISMVRP